MGIFITSEVGQVPLHNHVFTLHNPHHHHHIIGGRVMTSRNNKIVFRATLAFTSLVLVAIAFLVTLQTSTANSTLFTGAEHHQVTLPQAQRWTADYQKTSKEGELIAGYFGRNIFEKILSQENAMGVRIYKAKHDNGDEVFVLVGVDKKGEDIVNGVVGEGVIPCPPICSKDNILQKGSLEKPLALR
jgi:hypothetical protein